MAIPKDKLAILIAGLKPKKGAEADDHGDEHEEGVGHEAAMEDLKHVLGESEAEAVAAYVKACIDDALGPEEAEEGGEEEEPEAKPY